MIGFANPASAVWDAIANGLVRWIGSAVEDLAAGVSHEIGRSTQVDVSAVWFAGPNSPYAQARSLAGGLLVMFVLLGVLQGLVKGDGLAMAGRTLSLVPLAIVGMIATTVVVGQLVAIVDAASTELLSGASVAAFFVRLATTASTISGGAGALLAGFAALALLALWVELIVRAALIYLLVCLCPLGFAALLWPAARGVLRRTVELLLAAIVSKLAIAMSLAIGAAAIGDLGGGRGPGASLGTMLAGAVLVLLAVFAPFVVLRLVPVVEAAVVAQGISRAPLRAAWMGASAVGSAQALRRYSSAGGVSAGRAAAMASPITAAAAVPVATATSAVRGAAQSIGPASSAPSPAVGAAGRATSGSGGWGSEPGAGQRGPTRSSGGRGTGR